MPDSLDFAVYESVSYVRIPHRNCQKPRVDGPPDTESGAPPESAPELPGLLDHPFDHPDDPTGPSGSYGIDEAPNVSRPDPSGADQIDVEHQATDLAVSRASWQVPHIGVPFRSDMAAGWWTILLPAVQRGRCRGCPQCRGGRAPGVRQAASGVRASGQPFSAGCVDLAT